MCGKSKNIITCIQNSISFEILLFFFFFIKEIDLPSDKIEPFRKRSKINLKPVEFLF